MKYLKKRVQKKLSFIRDFSNIKYFYEILRTVIIDLFSCEEVKIKKKHLIKII